MFYDLAFPLGGTGQQHSPYFFIVPPKDKKGDFGCASGIGKNDGINMFEVRRSIWKEINSNVSL